ncbi:MAG: monovalent cation/H(+) antiporter subunit G [Alphaproteobacteria bacterium]
MEQVLDILSWICLIGGSFFVVVGGIGVLRMPDVYTRSHAAGITDTMGALLILVGLMFQAGLTLVTVKLVMILIFLLFTSPASSHALNHTAWANGLRPKMEDDPPVEPPGETDGRE